MRPNRLAREFELGGEYMAWDTDYTLLGIFLFGDGIDVVRYEVDTGHFGQSTDTYHVLHFQLQDDRYLEQRLKEKIGGGLQEFPVLHLMGRKTTGGAPWRQVSIFYRPWLFSLLRGYAGSNAPFIEWPGPTLAIACDKKINPHIRSTDG